MLPTLALVGSRKTLQVAQSNIPPHLTVNILRHVFALQNKVNSFGRCFLCHWAVRSPCAECLTKFKHIKEFLSAL